MHQLTPEGQRAVDEIAGRYGLSSQSVAMMLDAVANGGGTMAQFNISELGGSGQWMQGGMTMVGDMFNHGLKMTVDNLCAELSTLYFNQPYRAPEPPKPVSPGEGVSLFVPGSGTSNWWPRELGTPASSGAQNDMRYAYFPSVNRLAIDVNGKIDVYNTLDHQIGGFSQQQAYDGSITLTSQLGTVLLSSLPRVSLQIPLSADTPPVEKTSDADEATVTTQPTPPETAAPETAAPETAAPETEPTPKPDEPKIEASHLQDNDILSTIEKLGELNEKGFISDEEFKAKKAELLSRL